MHANSKTRDKPRATRKAWSQDMRPASVTRRKISLSLDGVSALFTVGLVASLCGGLPVSISGSIRFNGNYPDARYQLPTQVTHANRAALSRLGLALSLFISTLTNGVLRPLLGSRTSAHCTHPNRMFSSLPSIFDCQRTRF